MKSLIFSIYIMAGWSIFVWEYMYKYVLKDVNILQKWLKWFLAFIKCVASISHNLNHVNESFEMLNIYFGVLKLSYLPLN